MTSYKFATYMALVENRLRSMLDEQKDRGSISVEAVIYIAGIVVVATLLIAAVTAFVKSKMGAIQ